MNELKRLLLRLEEIAESCPNDEATADLEAAAHHLMQAIETLTEAANGTDRE